MTSSTLSGNSAEYGGGIWINGTATVANSIVAGNVLLGSTAPGDVAGNLTTASAFPGARLVMFGQELNPESYAICKADMLIKG